MGKNHVTERIFYLLLRQGQKQDKKLKVQVFLACLLVLLSFANLLCFYLVLDAFALIIGLVVSFAIDGVESINRKVAIGFSE